MNFAPTVSLLFLVKNERGRFEPTVAQILNQDYDGEIEYIAVDSGSQDGTPDYLRERGMRVIEIPASEFHHGRTRNLAADAAHNDLLVLISSDAVPLDENWLRNLVAPLSDPDVAAVYGRQIPPDEVGVVRKRYMAGEYPEIPSIRRCTDFKKLHPGHFRFSDANAAVRREDWARHRWSDVILVAEDQGLCRDLLLAGRAIAYAPEAGVRHGHRRNLIDEFRYAFDNGLSLRRLGILGNPQFGGAMRYGMGRLLSDVGYFLRRADVIHAVEALAVFAVKWAGVQVGQRGDALPKRWLRHLSEHVRRRARAGIE